MTSKWFNAKRAKKENVGTVRIFDQIGKDWFGEGTDAKSFVEAVDELGDDLEVLNVHINSPGGNVYDGLAIYNYLKAHSAEVVVHVDGIAASIASIIAMAGKKIIMPANSNVFIHNPWSFAGGDAEALRKTADQLDIMAESLLGIYMSRAKDITEEDVRAMMDDETLLTAEECVAWGFADEMIEEVKMAAGMNPEAVMAATREVVTAEASLLAADARIESLGEQISSQLTEINDLEAEIGALTDAMSGMLPQPEALGAEDVIALVAEAEAPEWLATNSIANGHDRPTVLASISEYSALADVCAAANITDADEICRANWSDTAALVSALLTEALAENEHDIHNRDTRGLRPAAQVDITKAYASRRPQ